MTQRLGLLPRKVFDYVLRSSREPEALARLHAATASVAHNDMQIGAWKYGAADGVIILAFGADRR